jgi:hypothetical protein
MESIDKKGLPMRVNLIYGKSDVLTGFLNIHPFAREETEHLKIADVKNLNRWAEDAEITELIANDVIDYFPMQDAPKIIAGWVRKLRIGGKIVISGIDLPLVAKSLSQRQIDTKTAVMLLHGSQEEPHLVRRFQVSLPEICNLLEQMGLKIMKKRHMGFAYVVEGVR